MDNPVNLLNFNKVYNKLLNLNQTQLPIHLFYCLKEETNGKHNKNQKT